MWFFFFFFFCEIPEVQSGKTQTLELGRNVSMGMGVERVGPEHEDRFLYIQTP